MGRQPAERVLSSASFCATVGDINGAYEMLTSAGGAWRAVDMDSLLEDLFQVSCASLSYCIAGDYGGVGSLACPSAAECLGIGEYTSDPSRIDGQGMFVTFTP
jgi:hypothetical protein